MENIDESFVAYMRSLAASVRQRFKTLATNNPSAVNSLKTAGNVAAITALSNMMSNPNDPNNPAQKKKTKIPDYKPTSVKPGDDRVVEPETIKKLRDHVEHGNTMKKLVEARVRFATDKQAKDFHSHIEGSGLATGTREGSSVEYDSSDTRKYVQNAIRRKMKELKGKVADVK
jgi:hypothetical protein